MTVELIATSVSRYQGLTDDFKPLTAPIGSTFDELDGLQRKWVKTGNSWNVDHDISRITNITDFESNVLNLLALQLQQLTVITGLELQTGESIY